jgi:hypothetical protein
MPIESPFLLSAPQAAGRLNLSTSTLAKLRLSGEGPTFSKLGRRVVYREEDLRRWVDANRFRSTAEYPIATERG